MRRSSKIQCGSVEVPFNVEGDKDFTDSLISHQFWGRYVVGGVVPSDTAGDKTIVQSRELTYNENTINCDSGHLFHGIKYVAHHAEATRQEQGQYTVHGNVIELGGVALALIGGISGIGKTTVSSCAQEAGWTWMSDEKFALEETGEYVQGLGQILDDEKTRSAAVGRTPDGYSHSIPIGAFVIPIVTGEATPTIHRYDSGKAMYHYYEELGRNITAWESFEPTRTFSSDELLGQAEPFSHR